MVKMKTQNQMDRSIRKDVELRGENWEKMQENRKWENRDGWIFLCTN